MTAAELDALDPLSGFRDRFAVTDPSVVYFDGNSLGRMPKQAAESLKQAIDQQWGDRLIRSWGEGWYDLPQRLGGKIAKLIGAKTNEVLCCDSTSVNLYKLVHSVLSTRPAGRNKIVTDTLNFPSDLYLLQGCARQFPGVEIVVVDSIDGIHLPPELIESELNERTALLTLSHVAFKSGFRHDLHRLTQAAHDKGVPVLWDLSHSAGAVPIDLAACQADYAVGCTYKYLNGGPGSPAFLYVRKDLQELAENPIWGWFGQNRPFDFSLQYEPAPGLDRILTGTPPILSMIGVEAGVDLLLEAGIEAIWLKSHKMYEYAYGLWQSELQPLEIGLGSPNPDQSHGSHLTFAHSEAYAIDQALIQNHKVIPDFRAPDGIRFGFAPLYSKFQEVERGVEILKQVVESKEYVRFGGEARGVT
ncbi:MAG: kynureninase [Chlorobia bacterium]|nr:kynureninase [Fimbriimonadaceae bacterium]